MDRMTLSDAVSSHLSFFLPFQWSHWYYYVLHNRNGLDQATEWSFDTSSLTAYFFSSHNILWYCSSDTWVRTEAFITDFLERELVFEFNKSISFHGLFDATHSTNLLRA